MATTEELKIRLGADVAGAVGALRILNAQLERLQKIAKSPDLSFGQLERVNALMAKTQAFIGKFEKGALAAGGAVSKTTKDFTNLGRVIQDLPFGFQGIQNNLTQLIPSVGGLGLAFSAVVTAITFAQIGFGAWTRGLGGHKKTLEDLRKTLEEYVQSLDSLTQARVRGAQDAQDELVKLKTLYDATQNQNISLKKRKELVDELQEQYPKYFANIKDETILAGGAQKAYQNLSAAILATAKARAAQDIIVDIQKQVLALDQQITDAIGKQANAIVALEKERKKTASGGTNADGTATGAAVKSYYNLQAAIKKTSDAEADKNKLYAQRNDLLKQAQRLTKEITDITVQNPDALLNPTGDVPKQKIKKQVDKILAEFNSHIARENPVGELFFAIKLSEAQADKSPSDTIGQKLTKELLPKTIEPRINVAPKPGDIMVDEISLAVFDAMNKSFQSIGAEVFSTAGQALADVITGGDLKSAFQGLFSFIGSALQELGKQMIALSPVIQALKLAIKSLNPALLLPAGIGLVAIGGVLKNLTPKGFATGGVIPAGFPNDSYLARLTSGERVLTPSQNKEWERGAFGGNNISFPEYLPVFQMTGNQWNLFYRRSNRFVTNTN